MCEIATDQLRPVLRKLEEIEDPAIAAAAISNGQRWPIERYEHHPNEPDSIARALFIAFYWSDAPEDTDYWRDLHREYAEKEGAPCLA